MQYQHKMTRRSNFERHPWHSGSTDNHYPRNLLSEEEYNPYLNIDIPNPYDHLLDYVDKPVIPRRKSNVEVLLKLIRDRNLIDRLRLAMLAEQEAKHMLRSKNGNDQRLQETRKWCNPKVRVRPYASEEKNACEQRERATPYVSPRNRRLCRHFLKGHCRRGSSCDFLHDSSIFCDDRQKVFLGGLPPHITQSTLREKMAAQGFEIINQPKLFRGFTPQVCLASVEQAQQLVTLGRICIDGTDVDVRPYRAQNLGSNDNKLLTKNASCSVFLGGLATGTTRCMIKDDLEKLAVKVVNNPLVKMGFSPQVKLGSPEQAQKLVQLKRVMINNTLVDVRAYVNPGRFASENEENVE